MLWRPYSGVKGGLGLVLEAPDHEAVYYTNGEGLGQWGGSNRHVAKETQPGLLSAKQRSQNPNFQAQVWKAEWPPKYKMARICECGSLYVRDLRLLISWL